MYLSGGSAKCVGNSKEVRGAVDLLDTAKGIGDEENATTDQNDVHVVIGEPHRIHALFNTHSNFLLKLFFDPIRDIRNFG